jgi:hypothetical protein
MTSTPEGARSRPRGARPVTLAAVLGGYALFVLLLVLYLQHRPQSQVAPGPANVPTARPDFPSPPPGAVVFSRELGPNALALAVVPHRSQVLVQASVLGADGVGVSGLSITFAVQGATATGTPCGSGCYRATLPARGRPQSVDLVVRGQTATRWRVAMPTTWPPLSASRLIARAGRVWRSLDSLTFTDRLASNEQRVVTSTWRVQAPDRLSYQVEDGWAAVIIGKRRWDRAPGGRWRRSPQIPVTQPTPPWVSATDARVLERTGTRRRPVWKVSFFDPQTPGWFTVVLDGRTLRTLELKMITTAHFMHEVYSSFNATPAIRAPR